MAQYSPFNKFYSAQLEFPILSTVSSNGIRPNHNSIPSSSETIKINHSRRSIHSNLSGGGREGGREGIPNQSIHKYKNP